MLYVFLYHIFVAVLPDRADEISVCPEFPSPQLFLDFWTCQKDFSRRDALDSLHYLLWTVHWHTLHQEMHMVSVCPYFQKRNLVSFADLQTDLLELLVYRRCEHRSSVLGWTDYVIHQHRDVMAFVDELAHPFSLTQQAARNLPCRDSISGAEVRKFHKMSQKVLFSSPQ